jgi:protein gp37
MIKTKIQWCDSTTNSTSGCDGCELWIPDQGGPCYAGNTHEQRLSRSLPALYDPKFTNVRLIPGRMAAAARWSDLRGQPRPDKPWLDGLPRIIFIGDMGDVMSRDVPFEYLRDEVFAAITSTPGSRHLWMLLTKQPRRLAEFARWHTEEWPQNLICGTSVTTQATTSRVRHLLTVPGLRFVSAEPLWEHVQIPGLEDLDLVIVGGESRQRGRPCRPCRLEWIRSLLADCRNASVPCFVKQLGSTHGLHDSHGGDWSEWPKDLRVRQFPTLEEETKQGEESHV